MPRLPGLAEKNTSTMSTQNSGSHTRASRSRKARLEARHQPDQQQAPRQPQRRDHFDDEVIPALHVMPGRRITADGLLEEDFVAIRGVFGRAAGRDGEQHRHEPQARSPTSIASGASHQRQPPLPRVDRREALPAGARAARRTESARSIGRKPTPLVNTPRPAAKPPMKYQPHAGPEQQVPQQRVQREGGEETQRRVDLRAARHHHELQRAAR